MITVQEALTKIRQAIPQLEEITVPIEDALDRVLAESISAGQDLPGFNNSGMDGIAVLASDTQSAGPESPVTLSLAGSIPAGAAPNLTLQGGQAILIMTGAPVPPGADAVIPVEKTNLDFSQPVTAQEVQVFSAAKPGDNVRLRGEYYAEGQLLIPAGKQIRPEDIGMFATVGKAEVKVIRQPRIGLLSTGDELIAPGNPLSPGKIWDSNAYLLAALLEKFGAAVYRTGIIPDQRDQIIAAIDTLTEIPVDLILTSGGVSMGAYDLVRQIVESEGTLSLWKVNMRPGKPVTFGSYKGIPFLGLPGNPVSAFVGFQVFAQEVLRKMQGLPLLSNNLRQARLTESVKSDGRETYIPGLLEKVDGEWLVHPAENKSSGNLYSVIPKNSLIIMPVGVKFLKKDDIVNVRLLD
ncbi:molybdopterin molybdotransferase MoeA [bacterium]|nr:molybdopterin molybdotransferase MoeA [bacterium]MCB2179263.1 molybdopterin molybdotransferase MoeA [bacterium]